MACRKHTPKMPTDEKVQVPPQCRARNLEPQHPEPRTHTRMSGEASQRGLGRGMRRHLLCAEPEPKGKQDPLQVSPMQVATPVGIKEDESKKTVQREHRRGVQLLGLKEKQG